MVRSLVLWCGILLVALLVQTSFAWAAPVNPGTPNYMWLFNESSGTTAAPYTGGVNGTLETGATFVPQATPVTNAGNHVVQIDGSTGNINFGTNAGFEYVNSAFTASFWLRMPATASRVMMLTKADALDTYGANGNSWAYQLELFAGSSQYGGGVISSATTSRYEGESSATPLDDNAWHHVAAILDTNGSGDLRLFVDGVERTTSIVQNNLGTYLGAPNVPLRFGVRSAGGGIDLPLLGYVDELGLYNRALTQNEIEWLAANSLNSFVPVPAPEPQSMLLVSALLVMGVKRVRRHAPLRG